MFARNICNHAGMPFVPFGIALETARLLFLDVRSTSPLLANSSLPQHIENAINGRINLPNRQYRLAEASGSCQAMYRPSPSAVQPPVPDNPKSPHAPGPGLAWIMDCKKYGSPQNHVFPQSIVPTNPGPDGTRFGRRPGPRRGAASKAAAGEAATTQLQWTDR
jgi:hypothetical protein